MAAAVWAYPRVCGGISCSAAISSALPGLSPRVRGNHGVWDRGELGRGPIPACAGESNSSISDSTTERAYPRVCGGIVAEVLIAVAELGLSPRVRGNRFQGFFFGTVKGPIPACAGESCPAR